MSTYLEITEGFRKKCANINTFPGKNSLLLKSVLKHSVIRQEGHKVLLYQNSKDLEILVLTHLLNCIMLGLTLF